MLDRLINTSHLKKYLPGVAGASLMNTLCLRLAVTYKYVDVYNNHSNYTRKQKLRTVSLADAIALCKTKMVSTDAKVSKANWAAFLGALEELWQDFLDYQLFIPGTSDTTIVNFKEKVAKKYDPKKFSEDREARVRAKHIRQLKFLIKWR